MYVACTYTFMNSYTCMYIVHTRLYIFTTTLYFPSGPITRTSLPTVSTLPHIWILANIRYSMSDIRYRIIAILLYNIVCFDIRYRMLRYRMSKHTISYYDIVYWEHTISYHLIYNVATYDIVCLTYDVVCNIQCRMFYI